MEIIQLKLALSNAYLIKSKKTVIVDTGSPKEEKKLLEALENANISPEDVSLILHTHAHVDHAGSTAALAKVLKAPSAVHAADAEMLARGRMGKLTPTSLEGRMIIPFVNKPFPAVKADLLIDEEMSLEDFGVAGRVIFTPGHTPGSISVMLDDGNAIVGDVMMGGYMGGNLFPSKPNYHYYAEDLTQVQASIRKLIALNVQTFYVGHGGPLKREAVVEHFARIYYDNP